MPEDSPRETDPRWNATQHGCCATSPLLPGEDPALWQDTLQAWLADYDPHTATAFTLVTHAAQALWRQTRCHHRLQQLETALAAKAAPHWTEADHHAYALFQRYLTTAQRAFTRAFRDLEYLRKQRMSEAQARQRAQERQEALHHRWAREEAHHALACQRLALAQQKHADAQQQAREHAPTAKRADPKKPKKPEKPEKLRTAEQWLEIRLQDGVTTTTYYPSNDALQDEIDDAIDDGAGEPHLIYRRLHFPDGIPPEYAWTNLHTPNTCEQTQAGHWCELCQLAERGGCGVQRLTYQTWRQVIEQEAQRPGQHAGPTGVGNFPQPKERGGETCYADLRAEWEAPAEEIEEDDKP